MRRQYTPTFKQLVHDCDIAPLSQIPYSSLLRTLLTMHYQHVETIMTDSMHHTSRQDQGKPLFMAEQDTKER